MKPLDNKAWDEWQAENTGRLLQIVKELQDHRDLMDRGVYRLVNVLEPARHEPRTVALVAGMLDAFYGREVTRVGKDKVGSWRNYKVFLEHAIQEYVKRPVGKGMQFKHSELTDILTNDPQFSGWSYNEWTDQRLKDISNREDTRAIPSERTARNENSLRNVRLDVSVKYGKEASERAVYDAVMQVALQRKFNPVQDLISAQSWDGEPRLSRFAPEVLGATRPIDSIYARRCFIGAVARAYEPGCKLDTIWILQGGQGARKSSLWKIMAFGDDYFHSNVIDPENKDAFLVLLSAWIVEWQEIDATTNKRDYTSMKNFLSNSTDKFRPPYGRDVITAPRRAVFVGSANPPEMLNDPTGSRRFWITPVGKKIDLKLAEKWRAQLWAEAKETYGNGKFNPDVPVPTSEQWWLTDEEQAMSDEANGHHQVTDTSVDAARETLHSMYHEAVHTRRDEGGVVDIRLKDLMTRAGLEWARVPRSVTHMLREEGFERHRYTDCNVWRGRLKTR